MPHELEQDEQGRTAFVSGRNVVAWHRLGTVLPDGLTAEQAMQQAYLKDWDIAKTQCYVYLEQLTDEGVVTELVKAPGLFTPTRTNPFSKRREVLGADVRKTQVPTEDGGTVTEEKVLRPAAGQGPKYTPVQNEQGVALLTEITDTYGEAEFETAGSIRGGSQVFVTMRLKGFQVGGRDGHNLYLVYLFNHLTGANICFATHIRVVCANTVDAALSSARFVFRHTASVQVRHQEAREALQLTFDYSDRFQAAAEQLIQEEHDLGEFQKLCQEIWPKPVPEDDSAEAVKRLERRMKGWNERNVQLKQLFLFSETQAPTKTAAGETTKWTAYNALVEYMDHHANAAGRTETERAEARALRTIDGIDLKERAYSLLTAP